MVEVWSMHNPTIREIFIINKARTFQPVEEEQALHNVVKLFLKEMLFYETTEDGSTEALLQILYGQYLILGVFGSCMF